MGAGLSDAVAAQLRDCPAGSRLLGAAYVGTSVAVSALSAYRPRTEPNFLCCLYTVLQRGYVWTLFTSAWYRPLRTAMDAVTVLVELHMAKENLPVMERELGSARFLAWSLMSTSTVNAVFLALMKLVGACGVKGSRTAKIQGLWPLVMAASTSRALRGPNLPMKVMGLAEVPSRWYPFALAMGLSAVNGAVQWDTLAAIAYGYACEYLQVQERLLPSSWRARRLGDGWLPRLLQAIVGGRWLPPDDPPRPPTRSRGDADRGRRERRGGGEEHQDAGLVLFGGPGHRLGS